MEDEEHQRFLSLLDPVFTGINAGTLPGVTSSLTLHETLVAPYRRGDSALAERYEALQTRSRGLRMVDLHRPLLRAAARLRAEARIKTPDALQIAAILAVNCSVYLTNDRDLPPVPGLRILQLQEYVPVA